MSGTRPDETDGGGAGAFHHHRSLWLASNLSDTAHLAAMGAALQRALENKTATPSQVAARALGVCLLGRRGVGSGEALSIALTGLDGLAHDEGGESSPEREALLAVCIAEMHGAAGRRLDALGMLRRARMVLDVAQPGSAAVYAAMLALLREGELAESGRDRMRASQAFGECAAHAATLLEDTVAGGEALGDLLCGDVPERLSASVSSDAASARVVSLVGRVRALVSATGRGAGGAAAAAVAREAADAIGRYGVRGGVMPLDLVEALITLTPEESAALGDTVLGQVQDGERRSDWEAVVWAARAHGLSIRGATDAGAELYERAGSAADEGVTPETAAFVRGLDLLDDRAEEAQLRDAIAEEFLLALSDLAAVEAGAVNRPDARAGTLLEAPIAVATAHVAEQLGAAEDSAVRVRLGLLVDILREPRWQPVVPELHLDPAQPLAIAGEAWELALDRPGRIVRALGEHGSAAVLVVQRVDERTLFIVIGGDGEPVASAMAGEEYRDAVRAVAGGSAGNAEGRRAFEALPAKARAVLRSRDHVLIVPDARVQDGALAFHRMYDGESVLREGRVIEHASSLREALRVLEPERDGVTRLLDVFADPLGDPTERLRFFENVRDTVGSGVADPRASAALGLSLAMTRLEAAEPAEAEWAVDRLIATADELGHRPTGTTLRAVRARALGRRDADDARRLEAVDEALSWLAGMRGRGGAWERLHAELTAERSALALRVRIIGESSHRFDRHERGGEGRGAARADGPR